MIARADADNRGVAVLAAVGDPRAIFPWHVAGAARVQVKQLKPQPYTIDRSEALPLIEPLPRSAPDVEVVWLSDGVDLGKGARIHRRPEDDRRQPSAHRRHRRHRRLPHALAAADNAAGALTVKVLRAQTGKPEAGIVKAIDLKGLPLGEAPFAFKPSEREADASIDLPVEIRNDVARLEIIGEHSAGAVQLLDKRWRRRTVGIVSGSTPTARSRCSARPII